MIRMLQSMILAPTANYELYKVLSIILVVIMTLCALFTIFVVLFQSGNSTGINAISGSSETFFGKNKSKSFESKMKRLTVICLILLGVCSIIFYLLQLLP